MYIRITRSRADLARFEEARLVVEELLAVMQRQPGFQSYTTGADRTAGTGVNVSIWDTEEHARLTPAVFGDVAERLKAAGVQIEPPEIYEVVAHS